MLEDDFFGHKVGSSFCGCRSVGLQSSPPRATSLGPRNTGDSSSSIFGQSVSGVLGSQSGGMMWGALEPNPSMPVAFLEKIVQPANSSTT